ncbi:nitrous oxide reductase accessory protein NosL (plasmid) [Haloferax sp. S1W]|uniref:nitrous oxide reductase accessory protein NosL n=1 Tax=Haloferax sp. S1W TaxID=3377110 RepID=UPI0037CB7F1E
MPRHTDTASTRPCTADSGTRHTRRRFLGVLGAGAVVGLTGCLGGNNAAADSTTKPEPIDLSGGKQDDHGGMVIGEHFGPNGQVFYRKHSPEGHDNPAWFHTLSMGLFPYHFERTREGWEPVAIYVTDYSRVEYELVSEGGETYISSHTAAETFGDATEMTYVVESEIRGGMGRELLPFSSADDANSFVTEYGGSAVSFDEVTSEWLAEYLDRS